MNKLILLLLLSTFGLSREITFFKNYDEGAIQALQENKKILFILIKENCRWCQKLLLETIREKQIQDEIEKSYILIVLDKNKDIFPTRYATDKQPSIFIINPNYPQEDDMMIGYITSDRFLSLIKK